jgi:hypothetical protein
MSTEARRHDVTPWIVWTEGEPESGYIESVQRDLLEAEKQIAAGQGIPAAQVWDELGIE